MKTKLLNHSLFFSLILLIAAVSCKAPKTLTTTAKPKPISTGKLIKNIEENAFGYKGLDVRRISCQYESPDEKASFMANLKSLKDEYILVSVNKLKVPVAKVLLTPDSVKMINYMDKSYFARDFGSINRRTGTDIDFSTIQSILANDIFLYKDDPREKDFRDFVSYVDSNFYILQSLKKRKLEKIERKGKDEKIDRYLKKLNEEDFIVQYLYVDPATFKIRRVVLDDKANNKNLSIDFSDYVTLDDKLYPADLSVNYKSPDDYLKIKIKLSKFSTEYNEEVNFTVPAKYKRLQ